MQVLLAQAGLSSRRLLLPLPFWLGHIQAFFIELLPLSKDSVLKLTRDQVKQLRNDNKESEAEDKISVADVLKRYPSRGLSSAPSVGDETAAGNVLKSVFDILPMYIYPKGKEEPKGGQEGTVSGKRRHGRDYSTGEEGLEAVRKLTEKARLERQSRK